MIEVNDLTKVYGMRTAVDHVSFTADDGDILGFLGPNGAGKTTTMRMLTCFMPATSGTATVAGYDIFEDSLKVRQCVGYMPENVPLYLDMTTRGYLQFVSEIKAIPRSQRTSAIGEAIEICGLDPVADRLIKNLSKGNRQRVGLAQAIINKPKVLILDEPTSGLDPKQIIKIRELIKDLAQNATVILSTHILPEVSLTCNKVAVINQGRIITHGPMDNLTHFGESNEREITVTVEGPEKEVIQTLSDIGGILSVKKRQSSEGARHYLRLLADLNQDPVKKIAPEIVKQSWGLLELQEEGTSLEQIFVKLISQQDAPLGSEEHSAPDTEEQEVAPTAQTKA